MQITAEVSKISKIVQRGFTFISELFFQNLAFISPSF